MKLLPDIFKLMQDSAFVRFCIVGFFATILDVVVFYIVLNFTVYQIALVVGYIISLMYNYYFTVTWTFKKSPTICNAFGVICTHMVNLFVVRMGLMYIFIHFLLISDKFAYIPTLVLSVFINFFMVKIAVKITS